MKKIVPWLIVGLVIRILLMSYAIHPDFRAVNYAGFLIAQKSELLDFYDHISKLPRTDTLVKVYGDDLFIYPPLAYVVHGISNAIFYNIYPRDTFNTLLYDIGSIRSVPQYPFFIFLLKLPYLFADICCLVFLRKLVEEKNKHIISILWILNPINLYVSYMVGQFDIFICVFILAALVYKKISPVLLGIAAGFKPFPLFLLPILPGSKIKNCLTGFVTYLILISPYLHSSAFRQYALFASLSDKVLFAKIAVSGSQYLSIFFIGIVVLYWLNNRTPNTLKTHQWMIAILLLFYSVTHFHPQWFLWIAPLLTLSIITNRQNIILVGVLLICYALIVLSFEPSLNIGLFGSATSLYPVINRIYPVDQLMSIVRSILAGTSVGYLLQLGDKKLHNSV